MKGEKQMKKVLKQPLFWLSFICFAAAIAIAVIGNAAHPGMSILAKLENGINSKSAEKVVSCMTPEAQAMVQALGGLDALGTEELFGSMNGKIHIVTGAVEEADDAITVTGYIIGYGTDGSYLDTESQEFDIVVIDGKQYLQDY